MQQKVENNQTQLNDWSEWYIMRRMPLLLPGDLWFSGCRKQSSFTFTQKLCSIRNL